MVKKKLTSIILLIKMFWKKKQRISTETCARKNEKQRENIGEIDIETRKKVWAKRVLKK